MNSSVNAPAVTTEHERLEKLTGTAFAIRKTVGVVLDNVRQPQEGEGKGSIKNIGTTVHDKMVELQDVLDEILASANELDSYTGSHQQLQPAGSKVAVGRSA